MITRIGLISDIHACLNPLQEALELFAGEQVDHILCAGDTAGYGHQLEQVVERLTESCCQSIRGNHDDWYLQSVDDVDEAVAVYLSALPDHLELSVQGLSVYMVHTAPGQYDSKGIRLLDETGVIIPQRQAELNRTLVDFNFDVLIVGHTHQVFCQQLEKTLVINPGSTQFNHSCGILTLPDLDCQFYALSGQAIKKSWNWSDEYLVVNE